MKAISNFNAIESINANNVEGGTSGCFSGSACYLPVVATVCITPAIIPAPTPVFVLDYAKTPVLDTKTPVLDTKTPAVDTATPVVTTPVVVTPVYSTRPVISCAPRIKSHGRCGR
jgi:hypothetical protein